ncbi:MAG: hypothetical protein ACE5I1_13915, partial [bacterium]
RKFLFNLFARRLLELNEFDQHGTITDANSFFHVSACYTHTEKYEEARQSLANLLSGDKSSLPARYWGYYGDTALHVHKGREANLGYMRLFASNPFDVDWSTFSHSGLQRLFRALLHENEIQYAYGCWPYYAWAENLLEIPKGNRYVSNILHENISNLKIDDLRLTPLERMHRFSLYVFYEQSSYEYSPDADIRAAMKALDEKLFKEYLLLCEKRKKEGEP